MPRLTIREIARRAGIEESTWRAYVARGERPPPDGYFGTTPYWRETTVKKWLKKP